MSFFWAKVVRNVLVAAVGSVLLLGLGAFLFGGWVHGSPFEPETRTTEMEIADLRGFIEKGPDVLKLLEEVELVRKDNEELRKKLEDSDRNVKEVEAKAGSNLESLGAQKAFRAVEQLKRKFDR